MSDPKDFELPSDTEKLSHKYILDSLKRRHLMPPSELEAAPPPEAPSVQLELPDLGLPPEQRYFRVNEVAKIIGVEAHVLRYWQSEFSTVRPRKSGNGHWVYSRRDVECFHLIRHLLYVEKYSVQGAKKRLKDRKKGHSAALPSPLQAETLRYVAKELKDLIQLARNAAL